jgi:hypothetical protein
MARKMVLLGEGAQARQVLTEEAAADELQLQELLKANPELVPVDEFGMAGPLLVIGRETSLPSGAVDLVALARSGELLVIEFKTGPRNADFRQALAQVLDYGSDLWKLSYEEFEATVPLRYFASDRCIDERVRRATTLEAAARAFWPDLSEDELASLKESLAASLASGAFHYVVAAQRFVPSMDKTVHYLNAVANGPRFYTVELVRFGGGKLAAVQSRALIAPQAHPRGDGYTRGPSLTDAQFLATIVDESYREALRDLLEACHGLGLQVAWGSTGGSIRVTAPGSAKPLSIAWLFPTEGKYWMGLSGLSMGLDPASAGAALNALVGREEYLAGVARLSGAEVLKVKNMRLYRIPVEAVVSHLSNVVEVIASLVQRASGA